MKNSTEWTKPFVASTSKLLLQQNTWSSHIWCFASNVDNSMSSQQFNVIALTLKFYKSVFIIWKVVLCVLQDWNCWGRHPDYRGFMCRPFHNTMTLLIPLPDYSVMQPSWIASLVVALQLHKVAFSFGNATVTFNRLILII